MRMLLDLILQPLKYMQKIQKESNSYEKSWIRSHLVTKQEFPLIWLGIRGFSLPGFPLKSLDDRQDRIFIGWLFTQALANHIRVGLGGGAISEGNHLSFHLLRRTTWHLITSWYVAILIYSAAWCKYDAKYLSKPEDIKRQGEYERNSRVRCLEIQSAMKLFRSR